MTVLLSILLFLFPFGGPAASVNTPTRPLPIRSASLPTSQQDPLANPGFQHFYNNEYDHAVAIFADQLKKSPDNAELNNQLAQAILYRVMFRNGALESEMVTSNNSFLGRPKMPIDEADRRQFQSSVQAALSLSGKQLEQNPNNIDALYANGVAHGLEGNYQFLVEKSWKEALKEATAARKAHSHITELKPDLVDAQFIPGLHEYILGSLPYYLRAFGFLAGIHGDRDGGIAKLQNVAAHGQRNRYDAQVLLAVVYRREHKPKEALALLEKSAKLFPRNYLFRLEEVQMLSDLGEKDRALQILNEVDSMRRDKKPGYQDLSEAKLRFIRGNLLFWYGDLNPATQNLVEATSGINNLEPGTAPIAWLRLGQVYDLSGRRPEATQSYGQAIQIAPDSEVGKQAKSYLSKPYKRKKS